MAPCSLFVLDVETVPAERRAVLRLGDEGGAHRGFSELRLDAHPASAWAGLFDTRKHVEHLEQLGRRPDEALAEIGVFLGEKVLGAEILAALAEGMHPRTLLVRLPAVGTDALAAAFARVPWEMARPGLDRQTLLERNLAVRAVPVGVDLGRTISIAPGEPVRVLLVFAEAPGSRPLAMRLERERLLDLFFEQVLPDWKVEVDVLCHGVTRGRLRDAIRGRGGYHVIHWSGHGHQDLLEIGLAPGETGRPFLSGAELVQLIQEAGGFIPRLVFLSACHSAAVSPARDRAALEEALRGGAGTLGTRAAREARAPTLEELLAGRPGYAGTALALLVAGVPQVVAMRYEVGDSYARRLGRRFYRGLLGEPAHHPADGALVLARRELADDRARGREYHAVDHATPLIFGATGVRLVPPCGRSAQMGTREPPSGSFSAGSPALRSPRNFVGRGKELTELEQAWLAARGRPVALVQGLGGMGKTALAAEVIHLWHRRFDHVLVVEARDGLGLEELYRDLDLRLGLLSRVYRERCERDELARLYLAAGKGLANETRAAKMLSNLVEALGQERILLVLDNLESILAPSPGPTGHVARDPAWDGLLAGLVKGLAGGGSRVLVTSRHRLAALAEAERVLWLPLGPLPVEEALLFFEGHRPLRELWYGAEEADRWLAWRVLEVSRGHPLILERLAALARPTGKEEGITEAGRRALRKALVRLEGEGLSALPEVLAGAKARAEEERERERRYLEDVAQRSVDLLLERLSAEARRLLWVVTRAREAVSEEMVAGVWLGPPAAGALVGQLLGELCGTGLLVREGQAGVYGFHELVRERTTAWMEERPEERGGYGEEAVWRAYGERYAAMCRALLSTGQSGARERALEAGRRGIQYLVRAGAYEGLSWFASDVVTSTNNPRLLGEMMADLQVAAEAAPAGSVRWNLRAQLADALRHARRVEEAMPLYAQAVEEAEAAEHWADVNWICHNWANGLRDMGRLDQAHEALRRSAEAKRRVGSARIDVMGSELEALRIEVLRGHAREAWPEIAARLDEVRGFWIRRQAGEHVPEAPNDEQLGRTLVGGLDVAQYAQFVLKNWQASLDLLEEINAIKRARGESEHELAINRFNRYGPLLRLGRLDEARAVIEGCLAVFRGAGDLAGEAKALSALVNLWVELGDVGQAIVHARRVLALCDRFPDPQERAILHHNLASCLDRAGESAEARSHRLAVLCYRAVTDLDASAAIRNLAIDMHLAATRGERYELPRIADLIAQPAFAALRNFLTKRNADLAALQADIDQLVEQIRQQPPQTDGDG